MILGSVVLLLVCFVVCVSVGLFVCFFTNSQIAEDEASSAGIDWSIFQHKIIVTMLPNENLYTYVKETDVLLCLNMSFLLLLLFCSDTVKKELWDGTQENKNN